jgi:ribosome-associated heat shock protein Hsp15
VELSEVRIDKWLWAMRIFKTRTLAADECRKGRIYIDGIEVKPSRSVKLNEVVTIRKPPVIYSYRITALADRRMAAKLVCNYIENLTPREEMEKIELLKLADMNNRDRGTGRPTKRDRRQLDGFTGITE